MSLLGGRLMEIKTQKVYFYKIDAGENRLVNYPSIYTDLLQLPFIDKYPGSLEKSRYWKNYNGVTHCIWVKNNIKEHGIKRIDNYPIHLRFGIIKNEFLGSFKTKDGQLENWDHDDIDGLAEVTYASILNKDIIACLFKPEAPRIVHLPLYMQGTLPPSFDGITIRQLFKKDDIEQLASWTYIKNIDLLCKRAFIENIKPSSTNNPEAALKQMASQLKPSMFKLSMSFQKKDSIPFDNAIRNFITTFSNTVQDNENIVRRLIVSGMSGEKIPEKVNLLDSKLAYPIDISTTGARLRSYDEDSIFNGMVEAYNRNKSEIDTGYTINAY